MNDKIAICLWIYHIDIWDEIKNLLLPHKQNIKVYIGLCNSNHILDNNNILKFLIDNNIDHAAYYLDNYGSDIPSFLYQLMDIKEKFVIKLHSKKSTLGLYKQINWRAIHFASLLQDNQIISNANICKLYDAGIVCNKHFFLCNQENTNSNHINEICRLIDLDPIHSRCFSAGTMFMAPSDNLQKYLINYIEPINRLLLNETQKINDYTYGTYTHAMERILGYICLQNKRYSSSQDLPVFAKLENNQSDKGYFSLIKLYNGECYIDEDIHLYGKIIDTTNNYFTIKWCHRKDKPVQKYILNTNTRMAVKYVK